MLGGYSVSPWQALPYSYSRAQPCVQWMEYSAIWSEYDAISWNVPIHHFDMYCRCFKPSKLSGRSQSTSAWSNIILVGTRLLSRRRRLGVSWRIFQLVWLDELYPPPMSLPGLRDEPRNSRTPLTIFYYTSFLNERGNVLKTIRSFNIMDVHQQPCLMLLREWRNVSLFRFLQNS